jgi:hypothetical protein
MMRSRNRTLVWATGVLSALAVLLFAVFSGAKPTQYRHPHPRPDVTADSVVPNFLLGGFERSRPAYAVARAIPTVLDGLRCYCNCNVSVGHRSLLSCFEDMHGAACDVCQREAEMAGQGFAQGESLERIRAAIDAAYGAG